MFTHFYEGHHCSHAPALHPQVISKEANFVTVRLNDRAELAETAPGPIDLLCSVRALLKKIKQTVLVGDSVQVDSIDWADNRGQSPLNPVLHMHKLVGQIGKCTSKLLDHVGIVVASHVEVWCMAAMPLRPVCMLSTMLCMLCSQASSRRCSKDTAR